jgi:hypothetical protein
MILRDKKPHFYKRLILRFLDVSIIGILYFIGGVSIATIMEHLFPKFERSKYEEMNMYWLLAEIFAGVSFIMIMAYIVRQTIYRVPFIFDKLYGYNHSTISEIKGGVIVSFSIFFLTTNFKEKIAFFVSKLY